MKLGEVPKESKGTNTSFLCTKSTKKFATVYGKDCCDVKPRVMTTAMVVAEVEDIVTFCGSFYGGDNLGANGSYYNNSLIHFALHWWKERALTSLIDYGPFSQSKFQLL